MKSGNVKMLTGTEIHMRNCTRTINVCTHICVHAHTAPHGKTYLPSLCHIVNIHKWTILLEAKQNEKCFFPACMLCHLFVRT